MRAHLSATSIPKHRLWEINYRGSNVAAVFAGRVDITRKHVLEKNCNCVISQARTLQTGAENPNLETHLLSGVNI